MNIYLDDRVIDADGITSLNDAIDHAARTAEQTGRLIIEVMIDGRTLTEEELEFERTKRSPPDEVRLQTADPHAMLRQTFAEAAEALGHADELQRDAAENIETGEHVEAMNQLASALEIWGSVHRAVTLGLEIGGIDLESVATDDEVPPAETIQTLEHHLRTIRDALSRQDPVGLSDTLQYDLPDVVAAWREMLTQLQDQLTVHIDAAGEHHGS